MKKYIKDLTNNEVIHARTEEEAIILTDKFHELGMSWCNGGSYETIKNYSEYHVETCYNPVKGTYGGKTFWEDMGYTIYTIEDILDFQTTFPEKWVIKQSLSQEVCDKFKEMTGIGSALITGSFIYLKFPREGMFDHYADCVPEGYVEITVEQFKEQFMKEEFMKEEFILPKLWALEKVVSDEDSRLVSQYARTIGGTHWADKEEFPKTHHLHVGDGRYVRGNETVWPEYTLITLEDFKKHVLKEDNKMETKQRTITHDQAQRIIDIACTEWKGKLSKIWAEGIVLKHPIGISEEFYIKMRKACTSGQHLVFDEIFGKDKEEFDSSMLKLGEFMFVRDKGVQSDGNRIVRAYTCLVDLDSPNNTYDLGANLKGEKIESGSVLEVKVK